MSDSNGFIYDPQGIKLDTVKQLKEVERKRIKEYCTIHKSAKYTEGCNGIWTVKCDVALPCATQNELDGNSAKTLVKNGCKVVAEGANMPTTPEGADIFLENNVDFLPGKAANAGGVAVSGLEMAQNSQRYAWTFERADAELKNIMVNIYKNISSAAEKYGKKGNYIVGANIAGFVKVADSMLAQGVI
jgi:glutamate dehydrogenase (NADP+)